MRLAHASVALNLLLGGALAGGLVYWSYRRARPPEVDYWTARHVEAKRDHHDRLGLPPRAIVLLGDSLTERAEWRELLRREDVYNRGISGDTAAGVRARLDGILQARPRAIALMIGINDLEAGRAPAEVAADIDGIVGAARAESPETKLIVFSVLPMRDVGRGASVTNAAVDALDSALAAGCERHGAVFVDLRPKLTDEGGALAEPYTRDGVHLTGEGYARWAASLSDALR